LRLADPRTVNEDDLRTTTNVKISIFPLDEVGVGAVLPAHLKLAGADPLIKKLPDAGIKPVDP
jgi:hypothetical protein